MAYVFTFLSTDLEVELVDDLVTVCLPCEELTATLLSKVNACTTS